jgi:hydrophobic/amphiphilic exporter-1 (mainly G- bacteria), HAE1 family
MFSLQELLVEVRRDLAAIPGIFAFATLASPVGGQRGEPLQFAVTGPDLGESRGSARRCYQRLSDIDGSGPARHGPATSICRRCASRTDRVPADLGLSLGDVAFAVNMLAGGLDIAKYNDDPGDGERYDIRVKATGGQLETTADLARIFIRTAGGDMVRLDSVASFAEEVGPAVITRYDLEYSAAFFATPVAPLGTAIDVMFAEAEAMAAEGLMPLGYQVKLIGEARELERTVGYIMVAFTLATMLVYMVFVEPVQFAGAAVDRHGRAAARDDRWRGRAVGRPATASTSSR